MLLSVSLLAGCTQEDQLFDQAMQFRKSILEAERCTFQTEITADYTDMLYVFRLDCNVVQDGTLYFTVTAPESIAGISGHIALTDTALTFDEKILAFPILADGKLTPVSAPWIFIQTLRSGYLTGCGSNGEEKFLYIDDSYEEHPLHLEIKADNDLTPEFVDIIWQDRRILSMQIYNFTIE